VLCYFFPCFNQSVIKVQGPDSLSSTNTYQTTQDTQHITLNTLTVDQSHPSHLVMHITPLFHSFVFPCLLLHFPVSSVNFFIITYNIISLICITRSTIISPGCGKTALVEALSKKSNLPIIRIVPSLLLRKWIGDTPLLTKAIFTAAKKLQPCIVFIDEMDSMFRRRTEFDHHHDRNLMTECEQQTDIRRKIHSFLTSFLPF
jgi:hypothetical protein